MPGGGGHYQRTINCKHIARRRERYKQVRLPKPRSKKVRPRDPAPSDPPTTVLRGSSVKYGDWRGTKQKDWRLRRPLQYAILRVALDSGIQEARLRKWWKERNRPPAGPNLPTSSD